MVGHCEIGPRPSVNVTELVDVQELIALAALAEGENATGGKVQRRFMSPFPLIHRNRG